MRFETTLLLAATVYGIAAVISFFVAFLIKGLYLAMNFFKSKQAEAVESEAISETAATSDVIAPEIVAAITAAVAATIGKRARVKHIRYRRTRPETGWSVQGRMTIMDSHAAKRR